jgi:mono/diheme cytochrome c family protein
MESALTPLPLICLAALAAACQPLDPPQSAEAAEPARTLALAQGACGGCHAVERYGESPNPNSPPFARIVNQDGLTRETLIWWLTDAHNYPEEMDFYLDPIEVARLADYMLTLRDPNYRPPI